MAISTFQRREVKFLLTKEQFEALLPVVHEHMNPDQYCVDGKEYGIYNIYYDTPDNFLIRQSIEKPYYKEKLRLRSYYSPAEPDSSVFLEVKKKIGGIADGRGMAAAFMLGACGIQMGTRFLVAAECGVHQNYKDLVLKATDVSTVVTGRRFGGNTCRGLKNPFSRNFVQVEFQPETTPEDVADLGVGALRRAAVEGDVKNGSFLAGQISGMVRKEQPAAEIVQEVCEQCEALLNGTRS